MYDYLAKVILLGPSGAGKSVHSLVRVCGSLPRSVNCTRHTDALRCLDLACYTVSSRMNVRSPLQVMRYVKGMLTADQPDQGESYRRKRSVSNSPPRSSKSDPDREGNG